MWNKVLTNINYVVQSTHSHPIPHIPPAPPSYNSPKHSQDKRMQATKRCSKTTLDKYNYNDTLHTQLNIGSVNICGALRSKTAYINNKFLQKTTHHFHILALLETKTSIEDSTWLKNAFPGYSVFVTGESKNKLWKDYRESEENKALKYRSNTLIDKQLISINEQKCQTLGGVVLLIRKDICKYFERVFLLPGNNAISISTVTPNTPNPTIFHFVYAPGGQQGKVFWEDSLRALKPTINATHWLIGDLNCYLSSRDSRSKDITAPKPLRTLMKVLNLIDIWRQHNPANELQFTPTFGRPNKTTLLGCVESRIDYILGPSSHLPTVLECNILPFRVAADHCPIQLKVDITLLIKDYIKPPKPPKIKSFVIPESLFDEAWVAYSKQLTTHLSTNYWTNITNSQLTVEEALEAYSNLTKTLGHTLQNPTSRGPFLLRRSLWQPNGYSL